MCCKLCKLLGPPLCSISSRQWTGAVLNKQLKGAVWGGGGYTAFMVNAITNSLAVYVFGWLPVCAKTLSQHYTQAQLHAVDTSNSYTCSSHASPPCSILSCTMLHGTAVSVTVHD